jgi:AraC family transcriptional regulator
MSFLGRSLFGGDAGGFEFAHYGVDRVGNDVKPHGHEDAHIMWAVSGEYRTAAEGPKTPSWVAVYNPPGTYHDDRFMSRGSFFAVTLCGDISGAASRLRLPKHPTQLRSEPAAAALRRLLAAAARKEEAAVLEALCLELVAAAERDQRGDRAPPSWLPRAEAELLESASSIGEIAANSRVHATHFVRTFRAIKGCTPGEFRRSRRLLRAAQLLRGKTSLAAVAHGAGFCDQSHFSRHFKAAFGLTPLDYRLVAHG